MYRSRVKEYKGVRKIANNGIILNFEPDFPNYRFTQKGKFPVKIPANLLVKPTHKCLMQYNCNCPKYEIEGQNKSVSAG